METTKPKVYGYIRVSTTQQEESGLSIEAQRDKIKAHCYLHDLELVGGVEEVASAKTAKRPGLQSLLDKARRREIDGIVILKLDRMFRNTRNALETTQELDALGVCLHSIQESLNTKSAMGRFFFTLMASIAELEAGQISERTIVGLQAKAARGERTGTTPYGFTVAEPGGQALIPNEAEQAVIVKAGLLRAGGASLQEIADQLNALGFTTRRGGTIIKSTVCRMLRVDLGEVPQIEQAS